MRHWNGKSWTLSVSAPSSYLEQVNAIAAISSNDIWTVGGRFNPKSGFEQPLIYHWEGQVWSAIIPPYPKNGSFLYSVAFATDHTGWAVGVGWIGQTGYPLIERYT